MSYKSSSNKSHHGSSKHHSSSQNGHSSKSSKSGSSGSDSKAATDYKNYLAHIGVSHLSFLFVVNELEHDCDNVGWNPDNWGTIVPPDRPAHYVGEQRGTVFRWHEGAVEEARGYYWYRPDAVDTQSGARPAGAIYYDTGYGSGVCETYQQYAVFNCWRPLPCVFVDQDPLQVPLGTQGEGHRFHLMSFEDPQEPGFTRIAPLGQGSQIVSGKRPSWMPGLVPQTFENTETNVVQSRGLGGILAVIIARIALNYEPGHTDRPFLESRWQYGRWIPRQNPSVVLHPWDLRGVLVTIAIDSLENTAYSTRAVLNYFQKHARIVEG